MTRSINERSALCGIALNSVLNIIKTLRTQWPLNLRFLCWKFCSVQLAEFAVRARSLLRDTHGGVTLFDSHCVTVCDEAKSND